MSKPVDRHDHVRRVRSAVWLLDEVLEAAERDGFEVRLDVVGGRIASFHVSADRAAPEQGAAAG